MTKLPKITPIFYGIPIKIFKIFKILGIQNFVFGNIFQFFKDGARSQPTFYSLFWQF